MKPDYVERKFVAAESPKNTVCHVGLWPRCIVAGKPYYNVHTESRQIANMTPEEMEANGRAWMTAAQWVREKVEEWTPDGGATVARRRAQNKRPQVGGSIPSRSTRDLTDSERT